MIDFFIALKRAAVAGVHYFVFEYKYIRFLQRGGNPDVLDF
jgi:hypothetical protein